MALLTPANLSQYDSAVPVQFNYWNGGGAALTDQVIIPAAAVQQYGGAGAQLFIDYIHVKATSACDLTFEDTGNTVQMKVTCAAATEKEMSPSRGPLIGCDAGTGLQITTSADAGKFELTLVARVIKGS